MNKNNQNGKGSLPARNNYSREFFSNYDSINWGDKSKTKRKLSDLTEKEYEVLKKTGYMYEFYPDATGNWEKDKKK